MAHQPIHIDRVELESLIRQMRTVSSVGVPTGWPPGARALSDHAIRLADLSAELEKRIEQLEAGIRSGTPN